MVLVHAANPARSSQEDGYDPTKCSMSMERFRQFYDAIRLERRGVHPRLVGDLFDYVDFTVGTAIAYASVCMMCVFTWCVGYLRTLRLLGLNGEHHLHPMGTSRTEHSSNAFDVLLVPLVLCVPPTWLRVQRRARAHYDRCCVQVYPHACTVHPVHVLLPTRPRSPRGQVARARLAVLRVAPAGPCCPRVVAGRVPSVGRLLCAAVIVGPWPNQFCSQHVRGTVHV